MVKELYTSVSMVCGQVGIPMDADAESAFSEGIFQSNSIYIKTTIKAYKTLISSKEKRKKKKKKKKKSNVRLGGKTETLIFMSHHFEQKSVKMTI